MFVANYQSIDRYSVNGVRRYEEQSEKRQWVGLEKGRFLSRAISSSFWRSFRSPFAYLHQVIAWPIRLQHLYWYSGRTLQNT